MTKPKKTKKPSANATCLWLGCDNVRAPGRFLCTKHWRDQVKRFPKKTADNPRGLGLCDAPGCTRPRQLYNNKCRAHSHASARLDDSCAVAGCPRGLASNGHGFCTDHMAASDRPRGDIAADAHMFTREALRAETLRRERDDAARVRQSRIYSDDRKRMRAMLASHALNGLLSRSLEDPKYAMEDYAQRYARVAVKVADATMVELDKGG